MSKFYFIKKNFGRRSGEFHQDTFSNGSRATNMTQNSFCWEMFLQTKLKLLVTKYFIAKSLFSYSESYFFPLILSFSIAISMCLLFPLFLFTCTFPTHFSYYSWVSFSRLFLDWSWCRLGFPNFHYFFTLSSYFLCILSPSFPLSHPTFSYDFSLPFSIPCVIIFFI